MTSFDDSIIATIAAACNLEAATITLDTNLADLGMDSMGLYALVASIEATHDCELTSRQIVDLMLAPLIEDVVTIVKQVAKHSDG